MIWRLPWRPIIRQCSLRYKGKHEEQGVPSGTLHGVACLLEGSKKDSAPPLGTRVSAVRIVLGKFHRRDTEDAKEARRQKFSQQTPAQAEPVWTSDAPYDQHIGRTQ